MLVGNTHLELRPDQKVIQIDHDSDELGRNHRIDLGINADASLAPGVARLLRKRL